MKAQQIPINKLDSHLLNPNEMSSLQLWKLTENIRETGHYPSVIVAAHKGRYIVLDGHNRVHALRDLEVDMVWCEEWKLNKKQELLFLATVNRLRGVDDISKRARLIGNLYESFAQERDEFKKFLPESEKALDAIIKISEGELEGFEEEIDAQRSILENQLKEIVDEDEAKNLAKNYKRPHDGKLKLVFSFDKEEDFLAAQDYFGKKPSIKLLMNTVYGKN